MQYSVIQCAGQCERHISAANELYGVPMSHVLSNEFLNGSRQLQVYSTDLQWFGRGCDRMTYEHVSPTKIISN